MCFFFPPLSIGNGNLIKGDFKLKRIVFKLQDIRL
jgi:hypothetical protein